jgi:ankyrin repeat protein
MVRNKGRRRNKILFALLCAGLLFSCKSGAQGQQKTLAQGDAEKVQLPDILPVPDSIKEIISAHISEDELNNSEYLRIDEDKRAYWYMWQSFLKSDIKNAFYNAVRTGNVQLVKDMIRHYDKYKHLWKGTDIVYTVQTRNPGNLEMVGVLLDTGFVIRNTSLELFACRGDDPAIIQLLIDRGAEITDPAVYWAASQGKYENLEVILKAGGNARAQHGSYETTALHEAAKEGHAECVALLLDYGAAADIEAVETWMGWTPLLWAAYEDPWEDGDSAECVALLLKAEANPEAVGKYGDLALRKAVQSGNERSVQLLLNSSAVNTINTLSPDMEHRQLNAVMEAALRGHAGILRMLIEKGGDVNMASGKFYTLQDPNNIYRFTDLYTNGLTALMLAGTPECVEILLQSGADVNAQDSDGRNALLFQCYFSSGGEIVSLLINAGSYLYLDRDGGRSLLRLVNKEAIALLKAAGCKDDDPSAQAEYSFRSYYAN